MTSGEIWEWCASSSKLLAVFLLIQNDLDFGKLFLGKIKGIDTSFGDGVFSCFIPTGISQKIWGRKKSVAVFGGIS